MLALGDSYTNAGFPALVAAVTNSDVTNAGVSSSRIVRDKPGDADARSFISRLDDYTNEYDVVLVFGGINDASDIASNELQLGDMSSPLDTTTFYGGMRLFVEKLVAKMNSTSSQLIGMIPPGITNKPELEQVQEAERTIYDFYGIPYIDLAHDCY